MEYVRGRSYGVVVRGRDQDPVLEVDRSTGVCLKSERATMTYTDTTSYGNG